MRIVTLILSLLFIAACSSSDGGGGANNANLGTCSNSDQKRFVRDVAEDWYLWNDLLPNNIRIGDYDSPEALIADVTTYSPDDGTGNPVDKFSFIGSAAADSAFFGEGQFEGFGFSSEFVAADDLRLLRVFSGSPADQGGLARGQRIVALDGRSIADIQAAEGVNAVLDTSPLEFTMQEPGGNQFSVTISRAVVTIDPVPQWRIIPANDGSGRMVGYFELATFISTADPAMDEVFEAFLANNVNDVIIDLRYNGGGLVNTARLLGDFLGGDVAENLVFSVTEFNEDRAAENNFTKFFDRLANSISLSRVVIIATERTASASELVINGMEPHVEVTIVGSDTFGKPIGQLGFTFCEKILRITGFQTVNADGFGDYFNGLPADCPVPDDLSVPVGDDLDPNMVAAMGYLDNGTCPVTVTAPNAFQLESKRIAPDLSGPAWRAYADAY